MSDPRDRYCECSTCGYEWQQGKDGSHSCTKELNGVIESQEAELTTLRSENERAKQLLRAVRTHWYFDIPMPSEVAIELKAAIDAAIAGERA